MDLEQQEFTLDLPPEVSQYLEGYEDGYRVGLMEALNSQPVDWEE